MNTNSTTTITISVARWYGNTQYYGVMPRPLFAALESAFLNGSPTAEVNRTEFETMLANHAACR